MKIKKRIYLLAPILWTYIGFLTMAPISPPDSIQEDETGPTEGDIAWEYTLICEETLLPPPFPNRTSIPGCNRIWIAGVFGEAPSFTQTYASLGYQYLPLIPQGGWGPGAFAAGYVRDSDNWAVSIGPGLYWNPVFTRLLFGIHLFYDGRMQIGRWYSQAGVSVEAYCGAWRGLINSYIPASRRSHFELPVVNTYPGNFSVFSQFEEIHMPVVEGLIGRCFSLWYQTCADLQIGLYTISPSRSVNYIGFVARGRLEQIGPLFLEGQYTYDTWFGSRGQLAVGLQAKWRRKKCRPCGCCDCCLYRPRPLQRMAWPVLDGCCNYVVTQPSQ